MTTLQERIGGERRRLKSVRMKLSAAVAQGASGETDWIPFYIAVGDYMEASIGRLLAQDIKMGDMIRAKVAVVDGRHRQCAVAHARSPVRPRAKTRTHAGGAR